MKESPLALALLAGSAVAQITVFPTAKPPFHVAAAIDDDLELCSAAIDVLDGCLGSAGGLDGILTADTSTLLNCVCCASATPIGVAYSVCSSILSDEFPLSSTEYEGMCFGRFGTYASGPNHL
jgi:hypothetical protein